MDGYKFEVRGTYIADSDRGNVIKFFEPFSVFLPEIVTYVDPGGKDTKTIKLEDGSEIKQSTPRVLKANALRVAQYVLKNFYVPPKLKEKYASFRTLRELYIVSKTKVKLTKKQSPKELIPENLKDMEESELLQFAKFYDLNAAMISYRDPGDLRQAIELEYMQKQQEIDGIADGEKKDPMLTEPETVPVDDIFA